VTPTFTLRLWGVDVPDTYVVTLAVSAVIVLVSAWTARRLDLHGLSLWQTAVEVCVGWIRETVGEIVEEEPAPYVPLIGTLMLFIAACNLLSVVPLVRPPTSELSTAVALALVVFLAVPAYGIRRHGLFGYLRLYARPNVLLLPINVLGELTRTLALCVRLFGNVMSGQMIGAILLAVAGLLVPLPLLVLGLLTGLIQAYIFGVLAAVYISAAVQVEQRQASRAEGST